MGASLKNAAACGCGVIGEEIRIRTSTLIPYWYALRTSTNELHLVEVQWNDQAQAFSAEHITKAVKRERR